MSQENQTAEIKIQTMPRPRVVNVIMKKSNDAAELFAAMVFFIVPWLMGLVLAKGGWETFFAIFPPYAWYLVVERVMQMGGMI